MYEDDLKSESVKSKLKWTVGMVAAAAAAVALVVAVQ